MHAFYAMYDTNVLQWSVLKALRYMNYVICHNNTIQANHLNSLVQVIKLLKCCIIIFISIPLSKSAVTEGQGQSLYNPYHFFCISLT